MEQLKLYEQLAAENAKLHQQLEEANETITAIRTGQIDALVVKTEEGHQLYTLKSADQTYRVFIEKMNEGVVTLNAEGTILYCNSRFAEMAGMLQKFPIGEDFHDFIFPGEGNKARALLKSGWEADCKAEVVICNRNGDQIPCLLSCNTIELDEGAALSVILTDLTQQKESERQLLVKNKQLEEARRAAEKLNDELENTVKERTSELLKSREYFKFLANNIPVIVWTAKPDGQHDYFNKRWYEYTGMGMGQEQGMGWVNALHPDDLSKTVDTWAKSIETGAPYEMEYRLKRYSDQQYHWHLSYAVPFKDPEGHVAAWFGTNTDIDDQRRQTEKRDEFIGIASHELKTPLTSLKGYLQIINSYNKEKVPAAVKEFVSKAGVSVAKLNNLVRDLLDVSKINAGKLVFNISSLDFSEMISFCTDSARHMYPEYNIESYIEPHLVIAGNAERLEQVFMNLVSNAVKYSQDNHKIIIEAFLKDSMAEVRITDFGIGLSDDQKDLIFERFYRVEDKKFLASGLGMGLYICSEIIAAHNGVLGVESELGKGSTFYFRIPVSAAPV
ncbi:ATP-binding protein [Arcticibacter tournemirensis]|uniref:histidine kinase n=1 Tax=Arcticibacter tournemirensis TaxID=699437 RepID=A0A4Q0ME35_9SPHI|nr:ATP-binding protein [Arcticibacter tournemirensis]RXF71680.1 PAS domain S-box protein [Arcticibacter tournemirensis]